ncbi:hypothetical protein BDZ91DRAFT_761418 [Kalaharituber pfeilii]|nr:hypothetical protein BDZ91DRAFT_761418 [Kalaharituber pfeilii]
MHPRGKTYIRSNTSRFITSNKNSPNKTYTFVIILSIRWVIGLHFLLRHWQFVHNNLVKKRCPSHPANLAWCRNFQLGQCPRTYGCQETHTSIQGGEEGVILASPLSFICSLKWSWNQVHAQGNRRRQPRSSGREIKVWKLKNAVGTPKRIKKGENTKTKKEKENYENGKSTVLGYIYFSRVFSVKKLNGEKA